MLEIVRGGRSDAQFDFLSAAVSFSPRDEILERKSPRPHGISDHVTRGQDLSYYQ
jgi:hypothetical protein